MRDHRREDGGRTSVWRDSEKRNPERRLDEPGGVNLYLGAPWGEQLTSRKVRERALVIFRTTSQRDTNNKGEMAGESGPGRGENSLTLCREKKRERGEGQNSQPMGSSRGCGGREAKTSLQEG